MRQALCQPVHTSPTSTDEGALAEPSSVSKTQKTKPGAAWTAWAAVERLERVTLGSTLCLKARSPSQ